MGTRIAFVVARPPSAAEVPLTSVNAENRAGVRVHSLQYDPVQVTFRCLNKSKTISIDGK